VVGGRTISCNGCFQVVKGEVTGPLFKVGDPAITFEVPCNCPSTGVQFTADGGGQLFCNSDPVSLPVAGGPTALSTEADCMKVTARHVYECRHTMTA
jgi:hypothetical protein